MTNSEIHCPFCNKAIREGDSFCASCDAQLPSLQPPEAAAGQDDPAGQDDASGQAPWPIVNVAIGLFLFLALLFAVGLSVPAVGALYPAQESALEIWVAVHLLGGGAVLVVWFMGARRAASPLRVMGFVRPRTSAVATVLLCTAALAFSIVSTLAYNIVVDALALEALKPPEVEPDILFPGAAFLLTFQALVMITPISEEALFRGFALRGLLNRIGAGPAVVATSVVFSAFHMEPGAIIPIFFTGLALGFLYVRTGSLWPCVAAHAGQNAIALLSVRAGL